jgi:hypothetical protein
MAKANQPGLTTVLPCLHPFLRSTDDIANHGSHDLQFL